MGSFLGGVHFELTGENVTECTGGPEGLCERDLPRTYTTYCDPRLNYAQGMEMAFLLAQYLSKERGNRKTITNWGVTSPMFTCINSPELASNEMRKIRLGTPNHQKASDDLSNEKNPMDDFVL